jgi:hypothetical protein
MSAICTRSLDQPAARNGLYILDLPMVHSNVKIDDLSFANFLHSLLVDAVNALKFGTLY